jgi:uncharacterized protein
VKFLILALLTRYKRWLSPALPPSCRFLPTCSEYAMQAIEQRGVAVGLLLSACRLLRCNPLAKGGYDPVPQKQSSGISRQFIAVATGDRRLND